MTNKAAPFGNLARCWAVPLLPLLAACGADETAAPSGQVVATVGGAEITLSELNSEMQALEGMTGQQGLRDLALRQLIERELLAQAAEDEGVARLPQTAMQLERLEKAGLVEALAGQIRDKAPQPSDDEVRQIVATSPASFAERRLLLVDQLVAPVSDPAVIKALEPLETLEEIRALLESRKIRAGQIVTMVDPLSLSFQQAQLVGGLRVGEVFILPEQGGIRISSIRQAIPAPITGDDALQTARRKISAERTGQLVANRMAEIVREGEGSVRYNPQFAPGKGAKEG